MRTGNIVRARTGTPVLSAASSSVLATRTSVFATTSESSAVALSASTSMVNSIKGGGSRQTSNRGRRPLWVGVQPHLSLTGAADRRGVAPPAAARPAPAAPASGPGPGDGTAEAAEPVALAEPVQAGEPVETGEPATPAEPAPPASDVPPTSEAPPGAPVEPAASAGEADAGAAAIVADAPAAPAEDATPKPAKPDRVHLTIDSLQNYELIEPIPVVIDPLGDKVFVAETPDLNISITGSSIGGAFLQLKDQISSIYESLRSRKFLDPERKRQLKMLETYIGKPKRAWYLARD